MGLLIPILVFLIIIVACMLFSTMNKSNENENDAETAKLHMEYISMLNTTFNKLRSSIEYITQFEEDSEIEKEFRDSMSKSALITTSTDDREDIKTCFELLRRIDQLTFDFEINNTISNEDYLRAVYRKIKDSLKEKIKNSEIADPLFILLAVKCAMQ